MHDLRSLRIPKISDSKKFEYLCKDIWNHNKAYELVQLNGRSGQAQDGVDVFGRIRQSNKWFGIQCKVRQAQLTADEIKHEIKKALDFNPKLESYIICTTADRDVEIQKIAREINEELAKNNFFRFQVIFWNDIEDLLKEESNFPLYHKYFKEFFANNETLGHAIGKLINLELGTGNRTDTHYEIMLGKVPKEMNSTSSSVGYYKGTYFIINFHERKMETFPVKCFPSDIEMCFSNAYDRFRISKWINSISDLDEFIYQSDDTVHAYISEEENKTYFDALDASDED